MVFRLIVLLFFFHFEGFICENSSGYKDLHSFEDKTGYDGLEFSDVSHIINKDQCKKKDSNSFICCVKHKELICLEGTFLRNDFGINISLSINNKTRWSDIISVSNPPAICPVNYPGVGDICLKISDIRIKPYHFCLQIVIKVHKVTVKKFNLGCFDENSNELSGKEFQLLKNTINKISMDENQSSCTLNGNYSFICCTDIDASVCLQGKYLPKDYGIELDLIVNNKTVWQEIISETNPPEICPIDMPKIAEICFKFYDVQITQKHFCLNMTLKLDLYIKVPIKKVYMGCFGSKVLPVGPKKCAIKNIADSVLSLQCDESEDKDNIYKLEVSSLKNKESSSPKFNVGDLSPNTKYNLRIFTVNDFGQSLPISFNISTPPTGHLENKISIGIFNIYVICITIFPFIIGFIAGVFSKNNNIIKPKSECSKSSSKILLFEENLPYSAK